LSELQGIIRFKFADGTIDEFKRLSAQCLELARANEPDCLQYDTYFNADESRAVVLERFRNSEALLAHADNLAGLMDPVVATAEVAGELLGDLSPELAERMAGTPVGLFTLYQSL